jgi:PAS domain S-box-containing protein
MRLTGTTSLPQLIDMLPVVVFEYTIFPDNTREFTYLSPRCEQILGIQPAVLLRGLFPIRSIIHPDDWVRFFESTEESLLQTKEWRWEGRIRNRMKTQWIEARFVPERKADGTLVCAGFVTDISERKEIEQRHRDTEKRYRDLLEQLPLGIGIHVNGILAYANEYAVQLMGAKNASELVGRSVLNWVHPDYQAMVKERMKLIMEGIPVPTVEEKYIRLDGKVIEVETAASPFVFQGQPAIQIIVKDITDKKEAQISRRKAETLFLQLFQNSPMAVVMLDDKGTVVEINPGFKNLFGYSAEELKGKGLNQFIVPDELESEGNDLNSLITNYQVVRIETTRKRKDGSPLSVILYGVPVRLEDQTIGIFGVYVDITERKKVEEELKVRNTELDNFVYKVSHDLRAPLSSILGLVNLANMPGNEDDPAEYLNLIGQKVAQLDHFISDVLSHSKNLKMEVLIHPVDLRAIIEQTFVDLNYLEGAKSIARQVDLPDHAFFSDPWRIAEIFRNLISNAIKYRKLDIDRPVISITGTITPREAKIVFEDNGIGIDTDKLPHVFDMFYRASIQSEGSGLGLYIVKNAVDKLGGTLVINSTAGQGTQFIITLPNRGGVS